MVCSKRTSYKVKPEQRWFEYDEEHEDSNNTEQFSEGNYKSASSKSHLHANIDKLIWGQK